MQTSNTTLRIDKARAPLLLPSPDLAPKSAPSKDVAAEDPALKERVTELEPENVLARSEELLDDAIACSFPASDPVAASPPTPESGKILQRRDKQETLLDLAIELTFPASDPIAVSFSSKPVALRAQRTGD